MEPIMKEKRETSSFIPYKRVGNEFVFFLQKRDMNAKRAPGVFGMFGGGLDENETPEEALLREVQEELAYSPEEPRYFSRYENANTIFNVFIEEVNDDFESQIKIGEGEYGKFLTLSETQTLSVSPSSRLITLQLAEALAKSF